MLKKQIGKNQVFSSLFISYLTVLLLPIVVTCLISFISANVLLRQVTDNGRSSAEQAKNILDSHIENAYFSTSTLLTNTAVASLRYKKSFAQADVDTLRQLQRLMTQIAAQDYLVSDFMIMFNQSQSVLSSQAFSYGEEFSYYTKKRFNMTYEEFGDSLRFPGTRTALCVPSNERTDSSALNNVLLLYNKNYQTEKMKESGVVVIAIINTDNLKEILDSLGSGTEYITYIMDQNTDPVFWPGKLEDMPSLDGMIRTDSSRTKLYGGLLFGKTVYSVSASDTTDWQYCFVLKPASFVRSVRILIWLTALLVLFAIGGGISFCYHMTKRQYSPMQILLDRLLYTMGQKPSKESNINEYEVIDIALNRLIKQRNSAKSEADKYRSSLAESKLRGLLNGYYNREDTLESVNERFGYNFKTDQFLVLLYSVENLNSQLVDENVDTDESALDLIYTFICSILKGYDLHGHTKLVTVCDDYIACLVCPDGEMKSNAIEAMANETAAYIKQRYDIDLLIGISNNNTGLAGISHSYGEARSVLEYSSLLGLQNSIMHYSELPTLSRQDTVSLPATSELEHRYHNCIKAYDFDAAAKIEDEIISVFFRENPCSQEQARFRIYGLINITLSAMEEIHPQIEDETWETLDIYSQMLTITCLTQYMEYTAKLYEQLSDYFKNRDFAAVSERDQRLVDYVNENYLNPNLNIAMLSDVFNMSPSYLSKSFKRITGQGLLDYIHSLRIQRAKQLMQTTDESMKNIAEQVGYSNNLTMIRAFRRYEGITPGAYKESLQA